LIIGFAMIAITAVVVVVNASNVFLQRRSLSSWADGAVLVAAQNIAYEELYGGARLDTLPLSEAAARDAVAGYVAGNGLGARFDNFHVVAVAVDPGTGRVSVELAASVPLLIAGDVTGGRSAFTITADASAVAPFR
ncbi:MAG: pilus assembly protein TadG-related protein, partial [Jiangellaceae bacterium]